MTTYYRGFEFSLVCVTTSKKKFSELTGCSIGSVNNYAISYDLRYEHCNQNPDQVFVKVGMGGEVRYVLEKDKFYTIEEAEQLVDKHRETYQTYADYVEKNGY